MASILDHVVSAVSHVTVYGSLRGTNIFVGKYFRQIYPTSNTTKYDFMNERKIMIILISPSKTLFFDMRFTYLKFQIQKIKRSDHDDTTFDTYAEQFMSEHAGTT